MIITNLRKERQEKALKGHGVSDASFDKKKDRKRGKWGVGLRWEKLSLQAYAASLLMLTLLAFIITIANIISNCYDLGE